MKNAGKTPLVGLVIGLMYRSNVNVKSCDFWQM